MGLPPNYNDQSLRYRQPRPFRVFIQCFTALNDYRFSRTL